MKINPAVREELKRFFNEKITKLKEKAMVICANDLTHEDKTLLLSHIPKIVKKDIKIDFNIDHSLLAGIVVKVGSKIMDLSLKGQLSYIRKKLYETA